MPLYHVWKLHVRLAQRLALTGIFLLGAFVIVASIYRFTTVLELNPMNLSCKVTPVIPIALHTDDTQIH